MSIEVAADEDVECTFTNTRHPLTDVLVRSTSQVDGGTVSTIECVDENGDSIGDDGPVDPAEVDIKDLETGVYVCTITISEP